MENTNSGVFYMGGKQYNEKQFEQDCARFVSDLPKLVILALQEKKYTPKPTDGFPSKRQAKLARRAANATTH